MDESIVKNFEQKVGTLKLSEAIRIGARIRPQCTGHLYVGGRSCALGAAWEGLGNSDRADRSSIYHYFDMTYGPTIRGQVQFRNDKQGHTREQIADWLSEQGL